MYDVDINIIIFPYLLPTANRKLANLGATEPNPRDIRADCSAILGWKCSLQMPYCLNPAVVRRENMSKQTKTSTKHDMPMAASLAFEN